MSGDTAMGKLPPDYRYKKPSIQELLAEIAELKTKIAKAADDLDAAITCHEMKYAERALSILLQTDKEVTRDENARHNRSC